MYPNSIALYRRPRFAGLYEPFRRWSNAQLGYDLTQQVVLTSMGAGSLSAIVGCEYHMFVRRPRFSDLLCTLSILWKPTVLGEDAYAGIFSCPSCRDAEVLSTRLGCVLEHRARGRSQGSTAGMGRRDTSWRHWWLRKL